MSNQLRLNPACKLLVKLVGTAVHGQTEAYLVIIMHDKMPLPLLICHCLSATAWPMLICHCLSTAYSALMTCILALAGVDWLPSSA